MQVLGCIFKLQVVLKRHGIALVRGERESLALEKTGLADLASVAQLPVLLFDFLDVEVVLIRPHVGVDVLQHLVVVLDYSFELVEDVLGDLVVVDEDGQVIALAGRI